MTKYVINCFHLDTIFYIKSETNDVLLYDVCSIKQWIFWVGPMIGAAAAALYHQFVLRAAGIKSLGSFRSSA